MKGDEDKHFNNYKIECVINNLMNVKNTNKSMWTTLKKYLRLKKWKISK